MSEGYEIVERVAVRMSADFGALSTQIMQVLVQELGGVRLTFPDLATIHRMERNRQIRAAFKGNNIAELAIRHNLHPTQIRRIVNG